MGLVETLRESRIETTGNFDKKTRAITMLCYVDVIQNAYLAYFLKINKPVLLYVIFIMLQMLQTTLFLL